MNPSLVTTSQPFLLNNKALLNLCFILVAAIQLLIHFLDPALEQLISYPVLFGVVLSIGLVHGCLDYEIERQTNLTLSLTRFVTRYVIMMAAVAVVWLFSLPLALVLFLILTAWHFGETDFTIFKVNAHPVTIMLYGLAITSWLIGTHLGENISNLVGLGFIDSAGPEITLQIPLLTKWITVAALITIVGAVIQSGLYRNRMNLLMLCILLLVTYVLPFMPAFTVYFGFWHSLHTLNLIRHDVKMTLPQLLGKAFPILSVSIAGSLGLVAIFAWLNLSTELVMIIFISSLTLPHAATMHGLLLRARRAV